jgi:hypothetical protein
MRYEPDPCKGFVGSNQIEKMKTMPDWLDRAAPLPA